mgnify:FL=1
MKKLILTAVALFALTGCNKQLADTTFYFDQAMIQLPNGQVVEGKVQSWTDYADGEQIQVKIDGKTYLVHAENICLINE